MAKNVSWRLFVFVWVGSALAQDVDWWQKDIIYQIYPLSFKDSNGDGYGDINGITASLEYLKQLNIGAISLPLMKAPVIDMDSEVSDYEDVDPVLGTMDDFGRLINKSNELGIKVILEFIPNHSSNEHPWFNNSVKRIDPYTDYYVWSDGKALKTKRAVPITPVLRSDHKTVANTSTSSNETDHNNTSHGNTSAIAKPSSAGNSTTIISNNKIPSTTPTTTKKGIQNKATPPPLTTTQNGTSSKIGRNQTFATTTEGSSSGFNSVDGKINTTVRVENKTTSNTTDLPSSQNTTQSPAIGKTTNGTKPGDIKNNSTKLPSKKGHVLPPNNWVSKTGGSAWQWNEEREQFYLHQSTANRPDLNYRNPELVQEMKDVLTFWLDKGVHGFHLVDVPFLFESQSLADELPSNDSLSHEFPYNITSYWNLSHTETTDQPETFDMVSQWREMLDNYTLNSTDGITRVLIIDGVDTVSDSLQYYGSSDAPGAHIFISCNFICEPKEWKASYIDLLIRWWIDSNPIQHPIAWMSGNQNVARIANRFSPELVDIMNTLILLLPGIPFTYYGEEIGMENTYISWEGTQDMKGYPVSSDTYQFFSRDPARTPFQWNSTTSAGFSTNSTTWLPVNSNYKQVNQKTESQVNHSHYNTYSLLAKLRNIQTMQHGEYDSHVFSDYVFGFSRTLEGHNSVIVLFNLGSSGETINLLQMKGAEEKMCVYTSTINVEFQEPKNVETQSITLPPLSTVVLSEKCVEAWETADAFATLPSFFILLMCNIVAQFYVFY